MTDPAPAPVSAGAAPVGPDLVVGPATRLLWRGPRTIQLELGSAGVVVDGLTAGAVAAIAARTGAGASAADEGRLGGDDARVALTMLQTGGYLWPRQPPAEPGVTDPDQDLRLTPPSPRLAGELRALQVRHGEGASRVLAGRRFASVRVEGPSRVGAHIASVLAAAGVGRVAHAGTGQVSLAQSVPGGFCPADEGGDVGVAADAALRRAAPDVDTTPAPVPAELTVLAIDAPLPDDRRDALHAAGAAHLCVGVGLDRGVVGPLVVPGLTSCARCADLVRRDHDPAWGAMAAQLSVPSRYGSASPVALATVIAGVAARQALAFLDGEETATIDGTLEVLEPDWRVRRRSWAVHPECGCTT